VIHEGQRYTLAVTRVDKGFCAKCSARAIIVIIR
jgi:hypothetical protein